MASMDREKDAPRYRELLEGYGHLLTNAEREIGKRLFGVNPPTMSALARERGISATRVSQIRYAVESHLMEFDGDPDYMPGMRAYVRRLHKRHNRALEDLQQAQEKFDFVDAELERHRSDVAAKKSPPV